MEGKPDLRTMNRAFKRGDHRISTRAGVKILAAVREPGLGRVEAEIIDLSITGFRMRCMTRLTGEKPIFLKLPAFAAMESKICWHEGDYFGCEFVNSLHPAVYNHIISKFPSLKITH